MTEEKSFSDRLDDVFGVMITITGIIILPAIWIAYWVAIYMAVSAIL